MSVGASSNGVTPGNPSRYYQYQQTVIINGNYYNCELRPIIDKNTCNYQAILKRTGNESPQELKVKLVWQSIANAEELGHTHIADIELKGEYRQGEFFVWVEKKNKTKPKGMFFDGSDNFSLLKEEQKESDNISPVARLLSAANSADLAYLCKKSKSNKDLQPPKEALEIIEKMVRKFIENNDSDPEQLREISALIPVLEPSLRSSVLDSCFNKAKVFCENEEGMRAFSAFLRTIHSLYWKMLIHGEKKALSSEHINGVYPLNALTDNILNIISSIDRAQMEESMLMRKAVAELRLTVAWTKILIDGMGGRKRILSSVENSRSNEETKRKIENSDRGNPIEIWLKQIALPEGETGSLELNFLCEVANLVLTKTDAYDHAIEIGRSFKKLPQAVFTLRPESEKESISFSDEWPPEFLLPTNFESEKDKSTLLFCLYHHIIFENTAFLEYLSDLFTFYKNKATGSEELLARWPKQDPVFIFGLVRIISHAIGLCGESGKSHATRGLFILKEIYNASGPDLKLDEKERSLFYIQDHLIEKKKEIQRAIYEIFLSCENHPDSPSIRSMAQKILTNIEHCNLEEGEIPQFTTLPNKLFNETINQVIPCKQYTDLFADGQLLKAAKYYVSVYAKAKNEKEITTLEEKVLSFLKHETQKVMLVFGGGGSGKTLSMKKIAYNLLANGMPEGFVPIYISLSLEKDLKAKVEKMQKAFSSEENGSFSKIVWFLDGVDEVFNYGESSFYEDNGFGCLKNCKVIFSSRRTELIEKKPTIFYEKVYSKDDCLQIDIIPLVRPKIDEFLNKYIEIGKKEGKARLWNLDQYSVYFSSASTLHSLISTPLYLYLAAETLPHIVAMRKRNRESSSDPIVSLDLLDAFFVLTVAREERKYERRNNTHFRKENYLTYAIEIAQTIQKNHKGGPILIEQGDEKFKKFFPEDKDEYREKEALRRCSFLELVEVDDKNILTYSHQTFYTYFLNLGGNLARRAIVKERLINEYAFDLLSEESFDD